MSNNTETALQVATKSVQPKPTKTDILTAMAIALWDKRQQERHEAEKIRSETHAQITKKLRGVLIKLLRDPASKVDLSFSIWDESKRKMRLDFSRHPFVSFDDIGAHVVERYLKGLHGSRFTKPRDEWIRDKVKELRGAGSGTAGDRANSLLANPAIKAALLTEAERITKLPTAKDKATAITV